MSNNNKHPVFSFFAPHVSKPNKQDAAVESQPLGYREHKKKTQQRQQKAIHDTKVWLGLIPEKLPQKVGSKPWTKKRNKWGPKPWHHKNKGGTK